MLHPPKIPHPNAAVMKRYLQEIPIFFRLFFGLGSDRDRVIEEEHVLLCFVFDTILI
jgi:hypothetical protein